jgi:hypothetical protein
MLGQERTCPEMASKRHPAAVKAAAVAIATSADAVAVRTATREGAAR